jgi:hypothetical protein
VRLVSRHLAAALAFALLAAVPLALPPAGSSRARTAQSGLTLNSYPIEGYLFQRARRCSGGSQVGARALERWMDDQRISTSYTWGIYNCRRIEDTRERSRHAEGRALDWYIGTGNQAGRRLAWRVIRRLLATDSRGNRYALARRMGIQEIIYDCQIWMADGGGLSRYGLCRNPPRGRKRKPIDDTIEHLDHVHIGLNWPGARRQTSYWQFYFDRWTDESDETAVPTARASRTPSRSRD